MKLYVKGARLAWANSLFTPQAKKDDPNSKPKFQSTFIVEPNTLCFVGDCNPDNPVGKQKGYAYGPFLATLSAGILRVAQEKFGAEAPSILATLKAQNRLVLHSGAEKGDKPGYKGNHYFNASNELRPVLQTKSGGAVTAQDGVFYAGCYVDAVLDLWAGPNNKKQPMVGVSLLGVVFSHDGERLAGGAVASADDFAPVAAEAQQKAAASGDGAASLF